MTGVQTCALPICVGGIAYITKIAQNVFTKENLEQYIEIAIEKKTLRRLIESAGDIMDMAMKDELSAGEVVDRSEQLMFGISEQRGTSGFTHIGEVVKSTLAILEERKKRGGKVTGIRTGFTGLDAATAGLQNSNLIILAARPGVGKTSFALNIAQNAATGSGATVAVFNLEMPAVQLVARMLSSESMVTAEALKKGDIKDDEWERIGEAVDVLSKTNIYIDDTSTITVEEICARCRKLKLEHNLGMVVIDYIQLISDNRKDGNRMKAIEEISRSLKLLSKDLNIPVIALSQLNRSVEKREKKEPMLSDLRESGAIEQDADIVMFLSREGAYNPEVEEPNKTKCNFAKHRGGEMGDEYLTWLGEYTKFSNWSGRRDD